MIIFSHKNNNSMNAIILAAGKGTRLRPLTNDRPKCMVEVNGIPMVEKQIQFLHEAGIRDITLVSGYKYEKLDFLKDKYGVDIIYNERYDVCNNIYSMVKVLDRFNDTWVIEGDVYMNKNCFTTDINSSTYFSVWKEEYKREWGLITDNESKLKDIVVGDGKGFIMSGISYWTKNDSEKIIKRINEIIKENDYTNLFWDNAVIDIYKDLDISVKSFNDIYEIDTETELREVERIILSK